ncbi:MAG TPA: dimethyl sulfone monooxygenase SfnG [Xanthobacteraceae bacterium]|nr:dimethyl sulfone monooxygenase SfnG [Xanthobacteraceae bacterium]
MSVKFAYWVPNVSGGLVVSKLPQRTDWTFEYNRQLACVAEQAGFDYALSQARFFASYGAEKQLEALTLTSALAAVTQKIKLISAIHPGLWHPGVIAKAVATIDHISNGRAAVNIVSGWFKGEFIGYGEPWLDHDERYRRSEEFIRVLKGLWTQETFTFKGDFYRINEAPLKPKPMQRPHPEIFQGGNSKAARRMAARVSDWYFMNGASVEKIAEQIAEIRALALEEGRDPDTIRFGVNGFVILRDTEKEAHEALREIIAHADAEAVEGFRQQVQFAGNASPEKQGMWAESKFEDLVQYNDGFKTRLIGTEEQIVERIAAYEAVGVDLVLCGFLHFTDELPRFGERIIPQVQTLPSRRGTRAAGGRAFAEVA